VPRASRPIDPTTGEPLLKMSELASRSGLPPPTILHYVRHGLLPTPPVRTGRTMAWYPQSYVERLRLVRSLQHDQYLPLSVIRDLLRDGVDPRLATAAQAVSESTPRDRQTPRPVRYWVAAGLPMSDVVDLAAQGFIAGPPAEANVVSGPDAELLDLMLRARRAGLNEAALPVAALIRYREAVAGLVEFEVALFRDTVLAAMAGDAVDAVQAAVALSEAFVVQTRRRLLLPALAALPPPGDRRKP